MESVHRHGGEVRAFIVAPVQPRERWQPSRPRPLRRISSSWPKSRARKRGLVGETTTTHPNVEFLGYSALAEVEIRFPEPPTRLDCQRGSLDPELPDHGVVQLLWVIASLEGLREELRIPPRRRASGPPAPGQARTQDRRSSQRHPAARAWQRSGSRLGLVECGDSRVPSATISAPALSD
jgi:hypothetical protein